MPPSSPVPASPRPRTADPFPFDRTGWLGKTVMAVALLAPPIGLIWAVVTLWGLWVTPLDLALFFGFWALTGLGITLGYHRLLAHRAFEARAPLRFVLLAAATMSIEGRPSDWAATHIRHHAMSDKPGDPHSPVEGFVHAHLGWLLRDRMVRSGTVWENLRKDPVVRFIDNTWVFWIGLSVAAPFLIGLAVTGTWMGAVQALMWGAGARIFWVHHLTWAVNSVGHVWGTRPADTPDKSRNNPLLALLTWGEGWHNNHHASPRSPFIGRRWYQVDIGAYVLVLLRGTGLVTRLWRPRRAVKRPAA